MSKSGINTYVGEDTEVIFLSLLRDLVTIRKYVKIKSYHLCWRRHRGDFIERNKSWLNRLLGFKENQDNQNLLILSLDRSLLPSVLK